MRRIRPWHVKLLRNRRRRPNDGSLRSGSGCGFPVRISGCLDCGTASTYFLPPELHLENTFRKPNTAKRALRLLLGEQGARRVCVARIRQKLKFSERTSSELSGAACLGACRAGLLGPRRPSWSSYRLRQRARGSGYCSSSLPPDCSLHRPVLRPSPRIRRAASVPRGYFRARVEKQERKLTIRQTKINKRSLDYSLLGASAVLHWSIFQWPKLII